MKDTLHENKTQLPIILASSSPRRRQLLTQANLEFIVLTTDIDESIADNETPTQYIKRMVATKANAVCQNLFTLRNCAQQKQQLFCKTNKALIITADTIGVLPDGKSILVKPKNKQDAFNMWTQMSAKIHSIWTAVQLTLVSERGKVLKIESLLEKTQVEFIPLTETDMEAYWQSGEPLDKAGGYAIQGRGAVWVRQIQGSYSNVVGLPLAQTVLAIKNFQNM